MNPMDRTDDLLATLDPEPFVPGDAVEARAHAHTLALLEATVAAETAATTETTPTPTPWRRRFTPRRRWAPAYGLAGVCAAVAIALLISQVAIGGGAVAPDNAAAAVLTRAAAAAVTGPPAHLQPGEYWSEETQGTQILSGTLAGHHFALAETDSDEVWIGTDGWTDRARVVNRSPVVPLLASQRSLLTDIRPNTSLSHHPRGATADFPVAYSALLHAPTSTAALIRFATRADHTPAISAIHDLLEERMVPARVQAGLLEAAAHLPGARSLGTVHDRLGRTALAVSFAERAQNTDYEFLFDPHSYLLLDVQERQIRATTLIPAGTVTENTAFISAGLTHTAPKVSAPKR